MQKGDIIIDFVGTANQLADIFTHLMKINFVKFGEKLECIIHANNVNLFFDLIFFCMVVSISFYGGFSHEILVSTSWLVVHVDDFE